MSLRRLLCAVALALMVCPAAASAEFSSTASNSVATNGSVHALAIGADGRTYLGGSFSIVGTAVGAGVGFDSTLATRNTGLASASGGSGNTEINGGQILDSVPDGSGGWYIGGTFGQVGGQTRNNLAHILPSGQVDPNFDPEPDGPVQYVALSGSTLYFTGKFQNVGSTERTSAAAVSTTSGAVLPWDPKDGYGDTMCGLQVYQSEVFICDYFSTYWGTTQTDSGLIGVDATTGDIVWSPKREYATGGIYSIYVSAGGTLYVNGAFNFQEAGGSYADASFGALQFSPSNLSNPAVVPFTFSFYDLCGFYSCAPTVNSMVQVGNTLYIGGTLTRVDVPDPTTDDPNNQDQDPRGNGAAFDVSQLSGGGQPTLLPWDPQASDAVTGVALDGAGNIVIGGNFSSAGGATRGHLAVVDPTAGNNVAGTSDPEIDGGVNTVAAAGNAVYAGGSFSIVRGASRSNLAILNADGTVSSVNPSVDGEVDALALGGSTLYAGGQFRNATGAGDTSSSTRSYLASFGTSDGKLGTFDPEPDGAVGALATDGTNLYAGGSFSHLGNNAHGDLAAFSLADGSPVGTFDPAPNGTVTSLAIAGNKLYAGGGFGTLSGESGAPSRSNVAAFDLPGLGVDGFSPPAFDGTVNALAASGSTVYAGGAFSNVGSTYRPRLAALDAGTGAVTSWDPQMGDTVFSLDLDGSTLYAGGSFTWAGGSHQNGMAGIDTTSGAATSFAPAPDRSVDAIATSSSEIAIGGVFSTAGGVNSPGYASFGTGGSSVSPGSGDSGGSGTIPSGAAGLTPAPSTSITSGPNYFTAAREVSFAFLSDTAGSSFQCSLDNGAFFACGSPYTTPVLRYGAHTFLVRAVSPTGALDAGGASESFVVETPQAVSTSLVPGAPVLGNVSVTKRITIGTSLRGKKAPGFHFRLSTAGTVSITLTRKVHKRWIAAGSLSPIQERAGSRFVAFSGAVQGGTTIAGSYRASIAAYSAVGTKSKAATVSFTLVNKPKPKPKPKKKPVKKKKK